MMNLLEGRNIDVYRDKQFQKYATTFRCSRQSYPRWIEMNSGMSGAGPFNLIKMCCSLLRPSIVFRGWIRSVSF